MTEPSLEIMRKAQLIADKVRSCGSGIINGVKVDEGVHLIAAALADAERDALEKACSCVFGQCSSDNEAQRIVTTIRNLMRKP